MYTRPSDLPDSVIADALDDLWGVRAVSLDYQAVGFGSHHWLAVDAPGERLFITVDDLGAKLRTADDSTSAAFRRLIAAFETALALRTQAGLSFVIAPVPAAGGHVAARLCDRYSLAVIPYLAGASAGEDGEFTSEEDRLAVVDMLTQIHAARAGSPLVDDFVVPKLDALHCMLAKTAPTAQAEEPWRGGPYARPAQELLRAHAADLSVLVRAYDELSREVAARPERLVITHGEPHAANVMTTAGGRVLVDWDTALLAPPERDLWHLEDNDGSLLHRYAAATGTDIDHQALTLYRLWFDLAEIASYLVLFEAGHEDTADVRESWTNLCDFLRPAERWPELLHRP